MLITDNKTIFSNIQNFHQKNFKHYQHKYYYHGVFSKKI